MISHVVFRRKFRCFAEGERIDFRPGVNLLVGDQGSGKSTLLKLMIDCGKRSGTREARERLDIVPTEGTERLSVRYFDFEQQNPRVQSHFAESYGGFMGQLASKFSSHGETVMALLESLPERRLSPCSMSRTHPYRRAASTGLRT